VGFYCLAVFALWIQRKKAGFQEINQKVATYDRFESERLFAVQYMIIPL
jgi:hypothetical protein